MQNALKSVAIDDERVTWIVRNILGGYEVYELKKNEIATFFTLEKK